jgi:hypothetical protein
MSSSCNALLHHEVLVGQREHTYSLHLEWRRRVRWGLAQSQTLAAAAARATPRSQMWLLQGFVQLCTAARAQIWHAQEASGAPLHTLRCAESAPHPNDPWLICTCAPNCWLFDSENCNINQK